MKYLILCLIITLVVSACKKARTPTPYWLAEIAYVDSAGNALFTNGSNGYFADSIKVYYYQNGVKTRVVTNDPTNPYGIEFSSSDSVVVIQTNFGIVKDSTTLFIHLKAGMPDDTLSCKFIEDDNVLALAWYNGVPKITAASQLNPLFTVVK